jgi:hypothetical protein
MMQRLSSGTKVLVVFWIAYGIVAASALYQALPPVNRDLLLILGGTGAILVIGTFGVVLRNRLVRPAERGSL